MFNMSIKLLVWCCFLLLFLRLFISIVFVLNLFVVVFVCLFILVKGELLFSFYDFSFSSVKYFIYYGQCLYIFVTWIFCGIFYSLLYAVNAGAFIFLWSQEFIHLIHVPWFYRIIKFVWIECFKVVTVCIHL